MIYQTVLLDLDDTLLDFGAASKESLMFLMSEYGRPIDDDEYILFEHYNDECWRGLERGELTRDAVAVKRFELFFDELGLSFDAHDANARFREGLAKSSLLVPGAVELCAQLSGLTDIYIVTNGFADTQKARIEASGLSPYLKRIFASQEIGFNKPDPRFFDHVLSELNVASRKATIILGDSLNSDMEGGRQSGLTTCWFNPKGREGGEWCDYQIRTLDEFISVLKA